MNHWWLLVYIHLVGPLLPGEIKTLTPWQAKLWLQVAESLHGPVYDLSPWIIRRCRLPRRPHLGARTLTLRLQQRAVYEYLVHSGLTPALSLKGITLIRPDGSPLGLRELKQKRTIQAAWQWWLRQQPKPLHLPLQGIDIHPHTQCLCQLTQASG